VHTWNPIKINFQHLWLMTKDAWRTNSWRERVTLWFKPTGYRPADVSEKYPVYKIDNVYQFDKYDTRTSPALVTWCWIQVIALLLFLSYLFGNIALINNLDTRFIFWYGAFTYHTFYPGRLVWRIRVSFYRKIFCWFLFPVITTGTWLLCTSSP
jgi:alkylglycerol monooxygenase